MDLRGRSDRNATAMAGNNDVREDILLETNFDEDGALTMAHTSNTAPYSYQTNQKWSNKQQQQSTSNTQNPLLQRPSGGRRSYYRSDTSIDRYSEYSLHGRRDPGIKGTIMKTNNFQVPRSSNKRQK